MALILAAHTLGEAIEALENGEDLKLDEPQTGVYALENNRAALLNFLRELAALRRYRYAIDEARQHLPR